MDKIKIGIVGVSMPQVETLIAACTMSLDQVHLVSIPCDIPMDSLALRACIADSGITAIICDDISKYTTEQALLSLDGIPLQVAQVKLPDLVQDQYPIKDLEELSAFEKKEKKYEPKQDLTDLQWKGGQPNCQHHHRRKRGVNRSK